MRRLNKKVKTIGMYGTLSKERYDELMKHAEPSKESSIPKFPELKARRTVEQITGVSSSNGSSMDTFEKEYREFINDLKKKKDEANDKSAVAVAVEETVDTVPEESKPKKKKRKKVEEAE